MDTFLVNGGLVKKDDCMQVSVFSPSFQYGLTVFEGIRGYITEKGCIRLFKLHEHIARLIRSADLIQFNININEDKIEKDIYKLIEENKPKEDFYIKYMLCILNEGTWSSCSPIDRVCFLYTSKSNLRSKGYPTCKADFTSVFRIDNNSMPPKIKCGANYINSRLGYLDVNNNNKDNKDKFFPIFLNSSGYVTESSGSCLFIISGDTIKTPPISSSILESITRKHIIEIARSICDLSILEIELDRWDILGADILFLAGTSIEIRVVEEVNGKKYKLNNHILQIIINEFKRSII